MQNGIGALEGPQEVIDIAVVAHNLGDPARDASFGSIEDGDDVGRAACGRAGKLGDNVSAHESVSTGDYDIHGSIMPRADLAISTTGSTGRVVV
jgi:hypothetical protein